jgi:hypothetical protein
VDTLRNGDEFVTSDSEMGSPTTRSSSDYDIALSSGASEVDIVNYEAHYNADAALRSFDLTKFDQAKDANGMGTWTKLTATAPIFKPATSMTDTRFDAVSYAVYLALLSSGHANKVNIDKGVQGCSPSMITAQLQGGSSSTARCYEAVHLAKNALEEITGALGNGVVLLSKRVQKEDSGYSLRSSVACIPCGAQDYMCWDLLKNGSCPRRGKCQWYHPQESDIGRVKVSIKCFEETKIEAATSEDQLPAGLPAVRHKISLGDLVR